MGGLLLLSIWNENPRIGHWNTSSQNISQYYVTTYLTLSCNALGNPCIFRFFYNSFVLVRTSNLIMLPVVGMGSFSCFKDLLYSLNTHSMPSLSSYESFISLQVDDSEGLQTFLPVNITPFSGGFTQYASALASTLTYMGWTSKPLRILAAWYTPYYLFDILTEF